eukprot:CAMPEP_0197535008 /NCGR_PEP_ID=MMETSP1318-20131121/49113_1 /TAXON_ID=552666 /ORGANISM="Partenskyella glossopodia, Strain RCC365" /LENGTH=137 /DNA_ID=CAMNT_0043092469 /DNA_START=24 /DNA_END=434 /DNA_ORIENTATION=-
MKVRKKYSHQLGTEEKWERLRIPWALQLHLPHHGTMGVGKTSFYYRALEAFSTKLMPFPYHYQYEVVGLLGITAAKYYWDLIAGALEHERGFDEVPSFTARDVVRLLSIDRNAYIQIANRCKRDPNWAKKRKAVIKT